MNEMQIFTHEEFGSVRTVDIDGQIWWVLVDVCGALGLANPRVVADSLEEDERRKLNLRQGDTWIINEPGLYSLILRSRKPEAKAFKRWVTHDVLPAIRSKGSYASPEITTSDYLAAARTVAQCQKGRLKMVLELLRRAGIDIAVQAEPQPLQDYSDPVLEWLDQEEYTIDEICAVTTDILEKRFREWCDENGIIHDHINKVEINRGIRSRYPVVNTTARRDAIWNTTGYSRKFRPIKGNTTQRKGSDRP